MRILRFKLVAQKDIRKISILILLIALVFPAYFFTAIYINFNNNENNNKTSHSDNINEKYYETPQLSSFLGFINLTNTEINKTQHYHNETIPIIGELFDGGGGGLSGYEVGIEINGALNSNFNATTDSTGEFKINFTIPYSLNIYSGHEIKVNILDPSETVIQMNFFIIYSNATSYFDISNWSPGIPGEDFTIPGTLRFDNQSGIPNQQIYSSWLNNSVKVKDNTPFSTNPDGSFPSPLTIPPDNHSDTLSLNFTYSGNGEYVNGSYTEISVKLFRNITCIWNTVSSASEGQQIIISGQIVDSNNTNIEISNRLVNIYYDNQLEGSATTDDIGNFQFTFYIPSGLGNKAIDVDVVNSLGLNIQSNTTHYISITGAIISETSSPSGKDEPKDPPFFNFFLVLIPIIIGGVVAFAIYAYFFLKKQKEESMLVKLPLESRIRNLKILKDTGRLEEALSYLFQSIYLELINAKYGRIKKSTETIRDFAIISVKELNLKPNNIYPFIQNVEKIIYDRPYIINEDDFYTAVALFSPIYFELTGYNFILNF